MVHDGEWDCRSVAASQIEQGDRSLCASPLSRQQFSDDLVDAHQFLDAFRPSLLEPGLYHADGQQRDEVYTYASLLESRMHAAGVTCSDCHNPTR